MLGVLVGYHRCFSHRSFELVAPARVGFAVAGALSGQKGPIWWSSFHRHHHRECDAEPDVHSPLYSGGGLLGFIKGFCWSHSGYLIAGLHRTNASLVFDLCAFPDLVLVEQLATPIFWGSMLLTYIMYGWVGGTFGFVLPTFLSWNSVQTVNSVVHLIGDKVYYPKVAPKCEAGNVWWLTPILLGDNWHNNHHAFANSCAHGFHWYQIDPNWYLIKVMEAFGLAHSLKYVSKSRTEGQIIERSDDFPALAS